MNEAAVEDLTPTAVERSDGRILTGVGADAADLKDVMRRHAPADDPAIDAAPEPTAPPSSAAGPSEEAREQSPSPKKTRGQARFDQLTGEREAAKREADAAKAEAKALKAQLEALRTPSAAVPNQPETPRSPVAPAPEKFAFPAYDVYLQSHPEADYDAWVEAKMDAHTDWKLAKVAPVSQADIDARIRASIEADRASRSRQDSVSSIVDKGRAAYPDFDAVRDAVADISFAPAKVQAMLDQPNAHDLIYKVAKDRALAERLAAEPDLVRFGLQLAGLVSSGGAAHLASTSPAASVIAPAPYQPVGSGSRTTVTPSADLARKGFDFDASGYRERRAAERKVNRR